MDKQTYELNIAGRTVRYRFREPQTARHFLLPLTPRAGDRHVIEISDKLMERGRELLTVQISDDVLEYKLMMAPTARYLLRYDALLIHAVAFLWRGRAWLLSAASGVGKSTQFRLWRELYGEDVQIICGDMPALSLESDGSILVSPSPWPGKERWSGTVSATLGGVVFLEQAEENEIVRLEPAQSLDLLHERCLCRPRTVEEIHSFAVLLDGVLSHHPVWLLRNRGDPASAQLTARAIEDYLSERNTP